MAKMDEMTRFISDILVDHGERLAKDIRSGAADKSQDNILLLVHVASRNAKEYEQQIIDDVWRRMETSLEQDGYALSKDEHRILHAHLETQAKEVFETLSIVAMNHIIERLQEGETPSRRRTQKSAPWRARPGFHHRP